MNNKSIGINEEVVVKYSNEKDTKTLHIYGVASHFTKGVGFISIADFILEVMQFSNISKRTAQRWITRLKESKLIKIKKGNIYIKGRKHLEKDIDTSRMYVQFEIEHLKSYSNFQKHFIRQIGLLTQRRMGFNIKHNVGDSTSLVNSGVVETELAVVRSAKQTGCSISQLVKRLGLEKMTISRALEGQTLKQFGKTMPIKGGVVRIKYKNLINSITRRDGTVSPHWGFIYNKSKDTYVITYALASRITSESFLSRKRRNQ